MPDDVVLWFNDHLCGIYVRDRLLIQVPCGVGSNLMFHIYVFHIAPLSDGNIAQAGTHLHVRRVPGRAATTPPCSLANLAIELFQNVIRDDSGSP